MTPTRTDALDKALQDMREYAGVVLGRDPHNGNAALTLGLVNIAERALRTEREEAFSRITALRLALRQIADEADASEPISVKIAGWAMDALDADDACAQSLADRVLGVAAPAPAADQGATGG